MSGEISPAIVSVFADDDFESDRFELFLRQRDLVRFEYRGRGRNETDRIAGGEPLRFHQRLARRHGKQ